MYKRGLKQGTRNALFSLWIPPEQEQNNWELGPAMKQLHSYLSRRCLGKFNSLIFIKHLRLLASSCSAKAKDDYIEV